MNYLFLLFICLSFSCSAQNDEEVQQASVKDLVIGQSVVLFSNELKEDRILNVYLPQGYAPDSSTRYPVIYVLDGGLYEDFMHIAGLVQFGAQTSVEMLPKSIVVGIANTDRQRDFTFPPLNETYLENAPTSGGSDSFMNFIEREVQPYINENYKTTNHETIIGRSLGGLLVTEILIKRSYLFDDYVAVSPSVWWDDQSLLKVEPTITDNPRLYLAVGEEAESMVRGTVDVYTRLKHFIIQGNIYLDEIVDQKHNDVIHVAAYRALRALNRKPEASAINPDK